MKVFHSFPYSLYENVGKIPQRRQISSKCLQIPYPFDPYSIVKSGRNILLRTTSRALSPPGPQWRILGSDDVIMLLCYQYHLAMHLSVMADESTRQHECFICAR